MQRWVNDYNMMDKLGYGYRPVLPLDTKDVGGGVSAIKMEKPDIDYKSEQVKKQVENDKVLDLGGYDLDVYTQDLRTEARHILVRRISKSQMLIIAIKKLLGLDLNKYIGRFF